MANKDNLDAEVGNGSFFLTEEIINQALCAVKSGAEAIFGDKELSGGNKFGILVARIRGIPIKDTIIGDISEADKDSREFRILMVKAKWALRKATQYGMTVTDILNQYPENIEYGDFLFVGTAVDAKSNIVVAVCATENESDDILAQEMVDQIKSLSKKAKDKYIADNQDKLTGRLK